jgi:dTDP-glucose pyrophosphorylase
MLTKDHAKLFVTQGATLRDVIYTIDKAELQLALMVDDAQRLLGTITDGDVRRALLRGATLEDRALDCMNSMPLVANVRSSEAAVEALMQRTSIRRIPVLDDDGVVVGLAMPRSEAPLDLEDNAVVIMAGGLGTRLAELTKDMPKPLLAVGPKPMLETIIERFVRQGFAKIYISVNHMGEQIEARFGDGAHLGARIEYLHEDRRLGTAGALQFLPRVMAPIIVINGDVLTKLDFRKLLEFHVSTGKLATMAVSCHDVQVPFGVVDVTDLQVNKIVEKPVYRYFVNAGIYVLDPRCLAYLPPGEQIDMTTLLERLLADGHKVASYPLHEYWQDVGRLDDYLKANREFVSVFESNG